MSYSGGSAVIYSELDLTNMVAKVGNYPDKVTSGNVYTIRQILAYNNVQVKFTIAVTITDSGTEKFVNDITGKVSIFSRNPELAERLCDAGFEYAACEPRRNMTSSGNKVATPRSGMTCLDASEERRLPCRPQGQRQEYFAGETFSFVK